jgi:hypothetical protein
MKAVSTRLASFACMIAAALVGCVDPYSDAVRWPAQGSGVPAQPVAEAPATGVGLRALAIEWTPDAVVVELEVHNISDEGVLSVERAAMMFVWDELEYAPQPADRDAPEPATLELGPGQAGVWKLRYQLGRALTGPGSHVLVRAAKRDGVAIVELPRLELPAIPARG